MVRGGFADHGGFPSFQFVKHFVEESFRLMVAEVLHPDVSSRGGSKIYTADPGRRRRRVSPTSAGTLAYSCEGRNAVHRLPRSKSSLGSCVTESPSRLSGPSRAI
jgi:hypothetical protein